ncbi:hypothetical protein HK096_001106 [Nowakowskiella sp. JEL0078]|nr:hypothetical protein HK096_001106 [Nowakowskiella sp. JEL0078]
MMLCEGNPDNELHKRHIMSYLLTLISLCPRILPVLTHDITMKLRQSRSSLWIIIQMEITHKFSIYRFGPRNDNTSNPDVFVLFIILFYFF